MTVLADSLTLGAYVGYFFFAVAVLLILGGTAFAVIFVRGRDNFIGWSAFWTTLAGLLILVISSRCGRWSTRTTTGSTSAAS
jgi:hypothetical protein